ncbi:hypothetical protein BC834DRAFT_971412 [Gloeopeniophorella convolvens]|nr:hypothetical protein BC834DRAFT_971412 [Gloeopeniophorella convolvens]
MAPKSEVTSSSKTKMGTLVAALASFMEVEEFESTELGEDDDEQLLVAAGISWINTLPGLLVDPEDIHARAQQCRSLDLPGSCMSSKDLGILLNTVENLYSTTAEAGSRIFINLILLRVAAMLEVDNKQFIAFPEFTLPTVNLTPKASSATRVGGQVDYLVAVTPTDLVEQVLCAPTILQKPCSFVDVSLAIIVAETSMDPSLLNHIPQAVLKVAALAKIHKKRRMRGALTTGKEWVFFIFEANLSGEGGIYSHPWYPASIDKEDMTDAITGVLKEWIEASVAE